MGSITESATSAPGSSGVRPNTKAPLIANGRIPAQAIIASIEADKALETEGV